jgi:hypothetical protein
LPSRERFKLPWGLRGPGTSSFRLSSDPRIFRSTARGLDFNELGRPAAANDLAALAKDHKPDLNPKRGITEVIEFIAGFPDGESLHGAGGRDHDQTQDQQNSEKKGTQGSETRSFHGIVISPFAAKYSSRWSSWSVRMNNRYQDMTLLLGLVSDTRKTMNHALESLCFDKPLSSQGLRP